MSYAALGTPYSTAGTVTGSHTVPMPTGTVRGERVLGFFSVDSTIDPVLTSAGWTQIFFGAIPTPDGHSLVVMEHIGVIGEPASYTFTTGSNYHVSAVIGRWSQRGSAAAKLSAIASSNTGNPSPVAVTANGVTAEVGDDLITFIALDQTTVSDVWTISQIAGMIERQEFSDGAWCESTINTQDNLSAGATGTKAATATRTSGSGNAGWLALTLALPEIKGIANNRAQNFSVSAVSSLPSGNLTTDPVVGNMLWGVATVTGDQVISFADTLGLTIVPLGARIYDAGRNQSAQEFTAQVTSTGAESVTASWGTPNPGACGIWVEEIKAPFTVAHARAAVFCNNGTGNDAPSSGNATSIAQPAVVLGFAWDMQGAIEAPGNGYSLLGTGWSGSALSEAKYITSTGAQAATVQDTGSDWHYVSVNVFTAPMPPTFTTQPVTQTVSDGKQVTLSVVSPDATSYQWFDNSTGSFAAISGAVSASYTFTASIAASGRKYYCVATNANGNTQSDTAIVIAVGVPQMRTVYERLPRGGDDVWDQAQAAVVLDNDVFDNVVVSSGLAKFWTGAAWTAKPVKYWNGSSWTTKPLKRWNGSAWV